jgi:hypothetical protein
MLLKVKGGQCNNVAVESVQQQCCYLTAMLLLNSNVFTHGRATEEGRRTGFLLLRYRVSAAGKRPRTQHHMAQLKKYLV